MAIAKQLTILLENRPGALAEVCSELARVAVNISAILVPDQAGVAPVRLVVNNLAAACKVLDSLGRRYTVEEVLTVRLTDRPGALGRVTRKLAEHGIDIRYAYGSIVKGSDRAMVVLGVSDPAAGSRLCH